MEDNKISIYLIQSFVKLRKTIHRRKFVLVFLDTNRELNMEFV